MLSGHLLLWLSILTTLCLSSVLLEPHPAGGQVPSAPAQESLRWERKSAEVKIVPADTKGSAHYAFQNVSGEPVTILAVSTSCHCLSAAVAKKVYAPQEKGEIVVTFTPLPNQGPSTNGMALVETDAPGQRKTVLALTGVIAPLPAGQLDPQALAWPDGEALQPKTIRLTFPEGSPIKEVSVTSTDAKVASAQVKAIQAGREYQIAVTPAAEVKSALEAKLIIKAQYPGGRSSVLIALVRLR